MNYAMILSNKVIDVLQNQKDALQWPPDSLGNEVTAVLCDNFVKIGMVYHGESGTFTEEIPIEIPNVPTPEPTDTELIMQTLFDSELRDFESTEERALLAQQMTDIELAILGGYTS